MRDGSGVIGAHADMLQRAERAIGKAGTRELALQQRGEMLLGNTEEAIAKVVVSSQFGFKGKLGRQCPGQARDTALDFAVEIGGVECWFGVIMLDGELVLLEDNDRSIMRQDAIYEHRSAMTREVVARVSERVGGLSGWNRQTVVVVWDPMRSVRRNGGLKEALDALGKRCPQLSAVVLAGGGGLEVHGVPCSANALDDRVREGILRMGDRPPADEG